MRLLIIGGNPKGHDRPFHPNTRSGKVLRALLKKHHIEFTLMNLWADQKEEDRGIVSGMVASEIYRFATWDTEAQTWEPKTGWEIVVLGKYQLKCLLKNPLMLTEEVRRKLHYLPHPAARRALDLDSLEKGLVSLAGNSGTPSQKPKLFSPTS